MKTLRNYCTDISNQDDDYYGMPLKEIYRKCPWKNSKMSRYHHHRLYLFNTKPFIKMSHNKDIRDGFRLRNYSNRISDKLKYLIDEYIDEYYYLLLI